jgi:hypothetical protein
MDDGSSLKHIVASTMTLQHHSGSDLPPKPQNPPPTSTGLNSAREGPYAHSHHFKVPKHFVYIQYGCGIQSEAFCSLNHDITTSPGLRSAPKTPKPTPHLYKPNSVRVDPYAHSHHIKVPKHFVYIQYGCEIHSEAFCSLNHGITTLLRLRSIPTKTPKIWFVSIQRVI